MRSDNITVEPLPARSRNNYWRSTLVRAVILLAVVVVVSAIPIVRESQVRLTDSFFQIGPLPRQPSQVLVVLIDEESLQKFGRWPWPRTLLAQINTNLVEAGATAVGLDILLSEPQSVEADRALSESFRTSARTVIVDKIGMLPEGPRWVEPLPVFSEAARVGHAQAVLDKDSVCRRFSPRQLTLEGPRWAFAIEVARQVSPEQTKNYLAAYRPFASYTAIDLAAPVLVRVPYRRGEFETLSARAVLDRTALGSVRGRPVLVGFGPAEIGDRLATPLSGTLPTPGVEIHAQILDSILTGRTLRDVALGWSSLALFLSCVISVVVCQRWRGWRGLACLAILGGGAYGGAVLVYLFAGQVLPAGWLILAVIFGPLLVYSADFVQVERTVTRQLLGLRSWLRQPSQDCGTREHNLSWKLLLLQDLQTELGALYELHRALLESTEDLIAIFDERGNPIVKNQSFSAGCPAEMKEMTLDQFRAGLSPKSNATPEESREKAEHEVYLCGEPYSLRLNPLPPTFLSPRGGTILTMTSLRARQERDLARAEALGFITHELRTPLTSIQGFAELMNRYPDSPSCLTAPETIVRESKRLLAMINSYLNVLRLDAGARLLQVAPIDIQEIVRQVLDLLQPLAAANGMRLSPCHGCKPVHATGDAILINGAILNLVSNAIKYGKPGTDVEVSWREQDTETIIAVDNLGEAVPAEMIPRLFDSYYRTAEAEKTAAGWGLGLAFVKRITEKHGGSVCVESHQGGMRFEIHLPAAATVPLAAKVPA